MFSTRINELPYAEKKLETNDNTVGQKIKKSPGKKTREIKYNQKIFFS